jgi:hypothetical protein
MLLISIRRFPLNCFREGLVNAMVMLHCCASSGAGVVAVIKAGYSTGAADLIIPYGHNDIERTVYVKFSECSSRPCKLHRQYSMELYRVDRVLLWFVGLAGKSPIFFSLTVSPIADVILMSLSLPSRKQSDCNPSLLSKCHHISSERSVTFFFSFGLVQFVS